MVSGLPGFDNWKTTNPAWERRSYEETVDCQGWKDCPECNGTGVRGDLPDYVLDLMANDDPALNCPPCNGKGAVRCDAEAETGSPCHKCGHTNVRHYDDGPDPDDWEPEYR